MSADPAPKTEAQLDAAAEQLAKWMRKHKVSMRGKHRGIHLWLEEGAVSPRLPGARRPELEPLLPVMIDGVRVEPVWIDAQYF